jgi:hypothetical protein
MPPTGGIDAEEVRFAPDGRILVATPGAGVTLPDDLDTDWDTDFLDLGYANEDGVTMTPSEDVSEVKAWQSRTAIKRIITGSGLEVAFVAQQFNRPNSALYFGADWVETAPASGVWRLDLPSSPGPIEKVLGVEWVDGEGAHNRLVLPRASITNREALAIKASDPNTLGLTYTALDSNGILGYVLTDLPS